MASLSYHVDQAVREENKRAIAGEPPLAATDPLLEGFFNLTLEEIGITPEMLAEAKAKREADDRLRGYLTAPDYEIDA